MDRELTICDIIRHYSAHYGEYSFDGSPTMWSEMKEIRQYYEDYVNSMNPSYTIEDIIRMCVRGLYKTWHQRRVKEKSIKGAVENIILKSFTTYFGKQQTLLVGKRKRIYDQFNDFEELYEAVKQLIGHINGIGYVTIYDTARRIGYLLRKPIIPCAYVYLHYNKVNKAAQSIIGRKLKYREPALIFFPYFCSFPSIEIEDLLCIYSDEFVTISEDEKEEDIVKHSRNINWRKTHLNDFLNRMNNILTKRTVPEKWNEFKK